MSNIKTTAVIDTDKRDKLITAIDHTLNTLTATYPKLKALADAVDARCSNPDSHPAFTSSREWAKMVLIYAGYNLLWGRVGEDYLFEPNSFYELSTLNLNNWKGWYGGGEHGLPPVSDHPDWFLELVCEDISPETAECVRRNGCPMLSCNVLDKLVHQRVDTACCCIDSIKDHDMPV